MIEVATIGILTDPGEETFDENGELEAVISPPVTRDGWHVNALPEGLAERPELEPYVVEPTRMRRVFAGREADTVALVFVDEAEAQEIIGATE